MNIPYDMLAKPNGCKAHGMQITEISAPRNWIDEFLSSHYMRRFEKIATLELTAVPGVIKVKTKDSSKTVPEYDGPPAPPPPTGCCSPTSSSSSASSDDSTKTVIQMTDL